MKWFSAVTMLLAATATAARAEDMTYDPMAPDTPGISVTVSDVKAPAPSDEAVTIEHGS